MAEKKMIHCARCGKLIEKKNNRLFCIKCRYQVDNEIRALKREQKKQLVVIRGELKEV